MRSSSLPGLFTMTVMVAGLSAVMLEPAAAAAVQQVDAGQAGTGLPRDTGGSYLLQLISGMFVVLLCIVVLAWFARRMNRFQTSADGSMHIIGGISMGTRERVVLLQVGEQQLLLGVAPGRINTLHVLDKVVATAAADAAARPSSGFSQHLIDSLQSVVKPAARSEARNHD